METTPHHHGMVILLIFVSCVGLLIFPSCSSAQKGYENISVDQLAEMLKNKDFILIDVHIPYAGEIPGTDLFIPYNDIDKYKEKLPRSKDAKIVVYCETGYMSAIAAKKLVEMGYTKVIVFGGGMSEWERSGRKLLFRPR
jgi:rhodanese-related sulfurtransferase